MQIYTKYISVNMVSLKSNGTSTYRQSEHCISTSHGMARKQALTLLEMALAHKANRGGGNIAYSLSSSCGALILAIAKFKGALARKYIVQFSFFFLDHEAVDAQVRHKASISLT